MVSPKPKFTSKIPWNSIAATYIPTIVVTAKNIRNGLKG